MTYHFRLEDRRLARRHDLRELDAHLAAGRHDPLSARRAWRNERGSTAAVAVKVRRLLLAPRSEVCRLPAFAAAPVRRCPAVYNVLPPMADRPPPEAPQVRCAHAPSLDGLRRLQVVRVRDDDVDQPPPLVVEDLPGSATSATG